jgi:hypothetical protein
MKGTQLFLKFICAQKSSQQSNQKFQHSRKICVIFRIYEMQLRMAHLGID